MAPERMRAEPLIAPAPAASSHRRFIATFAAALPAEVTVTIDNARGVTSYRIAGLRVSVEAEIARITSDIASSPFAENWSAWFTKPIRWGDEYVAHGEFFSERHIDRARSHFAIAAE